MKSIFKGITVILVVFSFSQLHSQTETLNFTINSETVQVSGQDISISSTLTKNENTLVWTQSNNENSDTTTFTIINITGNWDQSTSLGTVTYTLDIEGSQNELTLIGQESGTTATLTFMMTETQEGKYIFNIDTISYQ